VYSQMAYIGTGLALCIASQCTNHTGLALCIDTSSHTFNARLGVEDKF